MSILREANKASVCCSKTVSFLPFLFWSPFPSVRAIHIASRGFRTGIQTAGMRWETSVSSVLTSKIDLKNKQTKKNLHEKQQLWKSKCLFQRSRFGEEKSVPLRIKGKIFREKARGNQMVTWILRMERGMGSREPDLRQGLQGASDKEIGTEGPLEIGGNGSCLSLNKWQRLEATEHSQIHYQLRITTGPLGRTLLSWQVRNFHPQMWAPPLGVSQPKSLTMAQPLAEPRPNGSK